jgi:hypothetical protein
MKVGKLEIRWRPQPIGDNRFHHGDIDDDLDKLDRTGAFAVANTTAWWLAVMQLLNRVEAETVQGARNRVKDTNSCIAAVGAGEGVALVRQRLIETREYALSQMEQIKRSPEPLGPWD